MIEKVARTSPMCGTSQEHLQDVATNFKIKSQLRPQMELNPKGIKSNDEIGQIERNRNSMDLFHCLYSSLFQSSRIRPFNIFFTILEKSTAAKVHHKKPD